MFLAGCHQANERNIVLQLCLVLTFVFGVIVYRVIVVHVLYRNEHTSQYASIATSVTAALLNLVCIIILGRVCAGHEFHS